MMDPPSKAHNRSAAAPEANALQRGSSDFPGDVNNDSLFGRILQPNKKLDMSFTVFILINSMVVLLRRRVSSSVDLT